MANWTPEEQLALKKVAIPGFQPAAKREAVAHLRSALEMSERRACILVAADRMMHDQFAHGRRFRDAWNQLIDRPDVITSIGMSKWAHQNVGQ